MRFNKTYLLTVYNGMFRDDWITRYISKEMFLSHLCVTYFLGLLEHRERAFFLVYKTFLSTYVQLVFIKMNLIIFWIRFCDVLTKYRSLYLTISTSSISNYVHQSCHCFFDHFFDHYIVIVLKKEYRMLWQIISQKYSSIHH